MNRATDQVLSGLRIIDLSRWAAGEYATKLFADLGAEVIKVEKPGEGSLTRHWGPFPEDRPHPERSALFLHLNTNKQSIALDLTDEADRQVLLDLVRGADALVESFRPGHLEALGLGPEVLREINPSLVITRISPFGQTGPHRDRVASGITLQAAGGPMNATGAADRPPLRKPGLLEHYTIGRSAGAATLAAVLRTERAGTGAVIDISGQEVLLAGADRRASYLVSAAYSGMVAPRGVRSPHRHGATFTGPFRTTDGFVMVYVTNQAFWNRFVEVMTADNTGEDIAFRERYLNMRTVAGQDREDFMAKVVAWIGARPKIEVMEICEGARIPVTAYLTVSEVLAHPHFRDRGAFTELDHPEVGVLEYAATPWQMEGGFTLRRPAPLLDQDGARIRSEGWKPRDETNAASDTPSQDLPSEVGPLDGVRVVDLTVVWSGPGGTTLLGDLGAEVIRAEGNNRTPRQVSAATSKESIAATGYHGGTYPDKDPGDRAYDRTALFNWHARNKLSACMNLETPEGREAFLKLIEISDVLVENNSNGVLEKLGIGNDELLRVNPRLIIARMPPMGASGSMSTYLGYGPNFNSLVGIAAMDGYAGDDAGSAGENYHMDEAAPAGVTFAVLAALRHRRRTGRGQVIEFAQAENVMAELGEFFLDSQLNHRDPEILGNRDPHSFQDVLPTAEDDVWVACTVVGDQAWHRLADLLGDDELRVLGPEVQQHRIGHESLVERLAGWSRGHTAAEVVEALQSIGVAAGEVMSETRLLDDEHLAARGFFVEKHHPHVGTHRYPGHQWRVDGFDLAFGRVTCGFGEDNDYVYRTLLGYSADELAELAERNLVTDRQLA
ncbi:CaiB/BaiF CoA transferase family protein [Enemella sp. A6]|uniref:CaiB/BaiF CoA transferase family protein n=1 Tax=Enemella sp. A6 TaxID=3440152 RepID=UPI003EBA3355